MNSPKRKKPKTKSNMKLQNDYSAMCRQCEGAGCDNCGNSGLDFSDYRFHPSSLGLIMTESRDKSLIGETTKSHLLDCFILEKYGRIKDLKNKFIEKGLLVEEDSITLYSRATKTFFKKNEIKITNDFLIGTPDLFIGESIKTAEVIIDIKSSWDIHTFFATLHKPLNKNYYWQLQAYMDMTNAKSAKLVYCLVNTPEHIINDEKRKLSWSMGATTDESEEAQKAMEALEHEMKFDDIPLKERYIVFNIERDDVAIQKAKEKIILCREYLNEIVSIKKLELA